MFVFQLEGVVQGYSRYMRLMFLDCRGLIPSPTSYTPPSPQYEIFSPIYIYIYIYKLRYIESSLLGVGGVEYQREGSLNIPDPSGPEPNSIAK